ncbi:MAG: thiosulfate oxidation carrier complex protein SoxZ [Rhodobacteraceae bacterium]|nr:thiosulfate oxidation carrier complex protein SoxZ [Paracoccaceae bacterium]
MDTIDARPRVRVPRTASPGEVVQIRTLANHPMENGERIDADGNRVPRHIIHRFVCTFNDETVIEMDIEPSLAANPFIEFEAEVPESGTFHFAWHDDNGDIYEATADIEVA